MHTGIAVQGYLARKNATTKIVGKQVLDHAGCTAHSARRGGVGNPKFLLLCLRLFAYFAPETVKVSRCFEGQQRVCSSYAKKQDEKFENPPRQRSCLSAVDYSVVQELFVCPLPVKMSNAVHDKAFAMTTPPVRSPRVAGHALLRILSNLLKWFVLNRANSIRRQHWPNNTPVSPACQCPFVSCLNPFCATATVSA